MNAVVSVCVADITSMRVDAVYGYPKDEPARAAVAAIRDFLQDTPPIKEIILVCFSEDFAETYREALKPLQEGHSR